MSTPLSTLIVDDEPLALDLMERYVLRPPSCAWKPNAPAEPKHWKRWPAEASTSLFSTSRCPA